MNFTVVKVSLASAAVFFGLAVPAVQALDTTFHYKAGLDTGGDTLVTVIFTNGDRQNIKANNGLFFGGGVSIVNDAKDIETEIALTYKVDDITATNGSVTWSRWPIDALVFYRMPSVRIGGGLTYHLNPDLSGNGVVGGLNVNFKNSLGYILQADWRINDKLSLGARYTILDYELSGTTNRKVGSNGLGIVFSGHL
jgi:hypothetical protein